MFLTNRDAGTLNWTEDSVSGNGSSRWCRQKLARLAKPWLNEALVSPRSGHRILLSRHSGLPSIDAHRECPEIVEGVAVADHHLVIEHRSRGTPAERIGQGLRRRSNRPLNLFVTEFCQLVKIYYSPRWQISQTS